MKKITLDSWISQIEFEDIYICEDLGTTTLYFGAPKEMLDGEYPEAVSMEISVEFPIVCMEASAASVECSPTEYDEETDSYTDYDWFDVDMSYEDIEKLFDIYRKWIDTKGE